MCVNWFRDFVRVNQVCELSERVGLTSDQLLSSTWNKRDFERLAVSVCLQTRVAMVPRGLDKASFSTSRTIVLLLALILGHIVDAEERYCPKEASVNLSNAKRNSTGFFAESGQFFPKEVVRSTDGELHGCMCDVKICVSLCLPLLKANSTEPLGPEYFGNVTADIPLVYTTNLTLEDDGNSLPSKERFFTFFWEPCMDGRAYFLEPDKYKGDKWYLLKNGSLILPHAKLGQHIFDIRRYCFRQPINRTSYIPRPCSVPRPPNPYVTASYIGGLVSVPFLIATIFVYSVLPELRNVHGHTFRCYLCCLLVTYITLAIDRIPPPSSNIGTGCLVNGFAIYFSFLASFFWLNVMCFDMWWRFGGYGSLHNNGQQHNRKKFIGYSIYAWGTAIALTAICISLEFLPGLSKSVIRPGFQRKSCWFNTKTASALYFFGPVGLTIICNMCLFVSTSIRLVQHKRNTQRQLNSGDSKRHDDNKLLFSLYLKLFVIMGISWSTEVISGLWDTPKYVWYATDMLNALQGILIFVTFVWKQKILHSLEKRFKCFPRFTRNGFTFTQRNTDSRATITSSVDSTPRSNDTVALSVRKDTSSESRNSPEPLGKP